MGEFFRAFGAGVLSFVSPCVLPLVPVYLSVISGISMQELQEGGARSWGKIAGSAALFVLGFSVIFAALGAGASQIGQYLSDFRTKALLEQIGGAFVMVMGVGIMGIAKIPFLQQERRFHVVRKPAGVLGPVLLGMAFAFGWSPCVGPFLAYILSDVAANSKTMGRGVALLLTYSMGLGVPLMASALVFSRALVAFNWIKQHYKIVTVASGLILILMGFLLMSHNLTAVQGLFIKT